MRPALVVKTSISGTCVSTQLSQPAARSCFREEHAPPTMRSPHSLRFPADRDGSPSTGSALSPPAIELFAAGTSATSESICTLDHIGPSRAAVLQDHTRVEFEKCRSAPQQAVPRKGGGAVRTIAECSSLAERCSLQFCRDSHSCDHRWPLSGVEPRRDHDGAQPLVQAGISPG